VGNSPTNWTDPSGYEALDLVWNQLGDAVANTALGLAAGGAAIASGVGNALADNAWGAVRALDRFLFPPVADGTIPTNFLRDNPPPPTSTPTPQPLRRPVPRPVPPTPPSDPRRDPNPRKNPYPFPLPIPNPNDCDDERDGIVPIYKAPQIGTADRLLQSGFSLDDFSGNGFNHFAKQKFVADDYASRKVGYDGRVLQVNINKKIYNSRFIYYERRHNAKDNETELIIPAPEILTLNASVRFLLGNKHQTTP
jgi:hypothetical protein